jgi:hypothetical protein
MAFSTRRGRPRKPEVTQDFGTPELRFKHAHGVTQEPIDRCLAHGIIDEPQHRAALHLRWLHTIRYGASRLTTIYDERTGTSATPDDPVWRTQREKEYAEAVALLRQCGAHQALIALVINNETPAFMIKAGHHAASSPTCINWQNIDEYEAIHIGLYTLAMHWKYDRNPAKTPH